MARIDSIITTFHQCICVGIIYLCVTFLFYGQKKKRDAKNWSNSSSLRLITFAVPVNDINWHFTQWRYVFTSILNIETCFFVLQAVATRTQALEMFFFKCLVALSCFLRGQFIWKPGHFVWLQQEVSCFLILWQLCSSLLFKPKVDDCMNLT